MTRKDYELIADVLRNYVEAADSLAEVLQIQSLVAAMADKLAEDNPRFNKVTFMNAIYKDTLRLGVRRENAYAEWKGAYLPKSKG